MQARPTSLVIGERDTESALAGVKPLLRKKIVVSIAAGKKVSSIAKASGAQKIVRVMPNIAALLKKFLCERSFRLFSRPINRNFVSE